MKLSRHHAHVVTFGATVAALTLAIPGTASAQRGAGGGGGFFNNPAMRLWGALDQGFDDFNKELSLSEEQTEAVTRLVADFREENKNALGRWTNMRNSMRSRTRGAGGGGGGARGAGGGRQEHAGNTRSHGSANTRPGNPPRRSHQTPRREAGQDPGQHPRTAAPARVSRRPLGTMVPMATPAAPPRGGE